MIMVFYSVFDSKTASFASPFVDQSDGSAIRGFSDAVNDGSNPRNMWYTHPEDFSLFRIGSFDTQSGELISERAVNLVTASALKSARSVPVSPDLFELPAREKAPVN